MEKHLELGKSARPKARMLTKDFVFGKKNKLKNKSNKFEKKFNHPSK